MNKETGRIKVENLCIEDKYYHIVGTTIQSGHYIGSMGNFHYFANGTKMFYLHSKDEVSLYISYNEVLIQKITRLENQSKGLTERLRKRVAKNMIEGIENE